MAGCQAQGCRPRWPASTATQCSAVQSVLAAGGCRRKMPRPASAACVAVHRRARIMGPVQPMSGVLRMGARACSLLVCARTRIWMPPVQCWPVRRHSGDPTANGGHPEGLAPSDTPAGRSCGGPQRREAGKRGVPKHTEPRQHRAHIHSAQLGMVELGPCHSPSSAFRKEDLPRPGPAGSRVARQAMFVPRPLRRERPAAGHDVAACRRHHCTAPGTSR